MVTLELPEELPTVTTGRTTLASTPAHNYYCFSYFCTPRTTGAEAGSFLPYGSPSRPTATATCRPQIWVKRVSEGWTNVLHPDDTVSRESSLPEPSLLAEEEVPEI